MHACMADSRIVFVPIECRPLLGVAEAAALCGLTEKAIRCAVRRGDLLVCYVPGSSTMRIRRRDLDDWIGMLPGRMQ